MSETTAAKSARTSKICQTLAKTYPDAHCELNFRNPLELLVATILSARCTDKQVNIVTKGLFEKYRTAADFADAPAGQLEADIKSLGFFRNKANNLQKCCRALVEKHGGKVPRTMEELVELSGVGRKTANVVLGNAFQINEGVVVDTHVGRLAQRLLLSVETDPVEVENDLMPLVPREQWTLFSHWLIWHGRRRCPSRKPDCPGCEIRTLCPSADKV